MSGLRCYCGIDSIGLDGAVYFIVPEIHQRNRL